MERKIGKIFETKKSPTGWAQVVYSNGYCQSIDYPDMSCVFPKELPDCLGRCCSESTRDDGRSVCFVECLPPESIYQPTDWDSMGYQPTDEVVDETPVRDELVESALKSQDVNKLAQDHWNYIKSLLEAHAVDEYEIDVIGFHYRTAFIHGYKHGKGQCM